MKQPWIKSPRFDGWFVLAPPFVALFVVMLLPERFRTTDEMPLIGWVVLVMLVDVAHVYSTLFRTYADPVRFQKQRLLFLGVPLICYLVGVALHSLDGLWFWRVLAYLAVFHFVRQQYGFLRIYSRAEKNPAWSVRLDTMMIYAATLYPILWWHLTPGRHFTWFIEGDFVQHEADELKGLLTGLYGCLLVGYIGKEVWLYRQQRWLNVPRNLLVLGTIVSWYFGIIQFNGDLAFTMLNVVSHGVPYIALIWVSDGKNALPRKFPETRLMKWALRNRWVTFLGVLVLLAYLEEGLWDSLIWREHASVFGWFQVLPAISNKQIMALLVPLLALPQMTHYVLDGFIWRGKQKL
ncbi:MULTISPECIES: hypothetical protein [unclassified Spirosoma]|uniref:hypothetical protein n=1 Tax=unclassified Spirosoma TaxID=2621999 RepID=UPI00095F77B6|nr:MULTISPECIES: hypothetical protein [unclassified Spirosoma]MBN8826212.1 hypothetical protein [Spirosoma sp.]OJW76893.1 MAG: hypothetical protein BGO59_21955 [Spirosoma sp. 48-14]